MLRGKEQRIPEQLEEYLPALDPEGFAWDLFSLFEDAFAEKFFFGHTDSGLGQSRGFLGLKFLTFGLKLFRFLIKRSLSFEKIFSLPAHLLKKLLTF